MSDLVKIYMQPFPSERCGFEIIDGAYRSNFLDQQYKKFRIYIL